MTLTSIPFMNMIQIGIVIHLSIASQLDLAMQSEQLGAAGSDVTLTFGLGQDTRRCEESWQHYYEQKQPSMDVLRYPSTTETT